jgi:hypothetical protein
LGYLQLLCPKRIKIHSTLSAQILTTYSCRVKVS